eukprot:904880-Prorocentrum_lima.AAC.1
MNSGQLARGMSLSAENGSPANVCNTPPTVLADVRGVTLTSTKKDNCCWFGSSFVQLQQRHQGRGCCKD